MDAIITVGLIVGVPLILAILFRVSAILIFVSVAAGSLLAKYFGYDFSIVLGSFVHNAQLDILSNLLLQLLPVGLTLLFARKSASKSQFIFHLAPLVLTCGALGALTLPLLSPGTQGTFNATKIGGITQPGTDLIIAVAAISVLILAWFMPGDHKGRGKKHH